MTHMANSMKSGVIANRMAATSLSFRNVCIGVVPSSVQRLRCVLDRILES